MIQTLVAFVALVSSCSGAAPQRPLIGPLGVEVSDHPSAFVDIAKRLRPFQQIGGDKPVPTDESGWPKGDGFTVLMDDRPTMAWAPPMDDPDHYQPDESGTYHLSFLGKADVAPTGGSPVQVRGLTYDPSRNTSRAEVILPKGAPNLIILAFTHTQRDSWSPPLSGITGLRLIRPGYPADTHEVFTKDFLKALQPFSYLRTMGWLDTNYQAGYYGDRGHHLIRWEDRTWPTDASQGMEGLRPGTHGVAWEYIVQLANLTHKDLWINIPVSATGASPDDKSSYIYQLAQMLKRDLDPKLKIYVEHSNEVWNFGFSQYIWNKLAAVDEVGQGNSPLNRDGSTDQEQWSRRRHAQRLYQIAKIFESVFGAGSLQNRIRPIYAAWTIQPAWYDEVLGWMEKTYGAPKSYFYAMAETAYMNDQGAAKTATPEEVLEAMRQDSLAGRAYTKQLKAIATKYGLKLAAYEAGPDNGGGDPTNIGNRIRANRLPQMKELVLHHFLDHFYGLGGDIATYFALSSSASRFGCWGATEDLAHLDTPKFKAIYEMTGPIKVVNINNPGDELSHGMQILPISHLKARPGPGEVTLTWQKRPGAKYTVWYTTGGNFIVAARNLKEPKFRHRRLKSGVSYTYYVVGSFGETQTPPSAQVQVTPR
ncbi:hypothetical protein [Fimbriimonas ginsengisoli]|uniref:Fibronectin type-III domain-containing protein n=1 Tax=Fimbriimonas ginsengisoli Gsoil 348 TaxID=661478 RepID=A0A068NK70_FIMGI|nr:hypothetical protein [Fimbriimonas ginsengisoli]AIE83896.1 hypothetical protein OP10G_0528 [Fimbriimonas ginsengisoli Gsoil 348]